MGSILSAQAVDELDEPGEDARIGVGWDAVAQVQDMRRFGSLFVAQVERYRRDRNPDTVPIMNEILQR